MGKDNKNQNTGKHQFNGIGRPKHKGSITKKVDALMGVRSNWDRMVEMELLQLKTEAKDVNKAVLERTAILRADQKLKQIKKENGPRKEFINNPFATLPEMVFGSKR